MAGGFGCQCTGLALPLQSIVTDLTTTTHASAHFACQCLHAALHRRREVQPRHAAPHTRTLQAYVATKA